MLGKTNNYKTNAVIYLGHSKYSCKAILNTPKKGSVLVNFKEKETKKIGDSVNIYMLRYFEQICPFCYSKIKFVPIRTYAKVLPELHEKECTRVFQHAYDVAEKYLGKHIDYSIFNEGKKDITSNPNEIKYDIYNYIIKNDEQEISYHHMPNYNEYYLKTVPCSEQVLYCEHCNKFFIREQYVRYGIKSSLFLNCFNVFIQNPDTIPERKDILEKYIHKNASKSFRIVVSKSLYLCAEKRHEVMELKINFPFFVDKDRKKIEYRYITVNYCYNCKTLYILKDFMNEIKLIPAWRYTDATISFGSSWGYSSSSTSTRDYSTYKNKSYINELGYNVNVNDPRTQSHFQRMILVVRLINEGLITQSQMLSYIKTQIDRFEGSPKYNDAVIKWEEDYNAIKSYDFDLLLQEFSEFSERYGEYAFL